MITVQELIRRLSLFWEEQACIIHQGHDLEVGAGTFNPATFLRCLGPEPYKAAYLEPSRRPSDGRYGNNPNRVQMFHQYQVILKPSPPNIQELYLNSLTAVGFNLNEHDIRFVHDDWESPTLGAWGLGWEVWIDGMEITQFTYFQSVGGISLKPITGELTYGVERLAMYLQKVDNLFELQWNDRLTYGDIFHRNEVEWSHYNFESANTDMWWRHFEDFEAEAKRLMAAKLPLPAYDFVCKASHAFNILDARNVISVTERTGYIARIRTLACMIANAYVKSRKDLGFPLLKKENKLSLPAIAPKVLAPFNANDFEDFVLEIGSEELPASFVPIGLSNLKYAMEQLLTQEGISYTSIKVLGTPRRLTVYVTSLSCGKAASFEERKGPPCRVAFDKEGQASKAGLGFFKSIGRPPIDLENIRLGNVKGLRIQELKKMDYLFATIELPEKSTLSILAKHLPKLILGLDFPKKMRWANWDISYPRPLRWMMALHGKQVVPFAIADLTSGQASSGHPQLSPGKIEISQASDYISALRHRKVMVDPEERKKCIFDQLAKIENSESAKVVEQERLIPQVLHLVEWPMLTVAKFDENFLKAPKQVLISEMVEHQKYFPLETCDGHLKNRFIITANNSPSEEIRHGNVKVISARLADGVFLYEQDLKKPLEDFNELLKQITFQKELGSVYDKVMRLVDNVEILHKHLNISELKTVKRAALLCKSDLSSELVNEFPNLQGIVGRLYALAHHESPEVADAIDEHWMPKGEKAPLPQSSAGIILSLAEKLDNLITCFSLGLKPTSSSDPYALRRQVLGIIKILITGKHCLDLSAVIEACYDRFVAKATTKQAFNKATTLEEIQVFFTRRIKTVFQDFALSKDEIEATLSSGFTDIYQCFCRAQALHEFRKSGDQFSLLYEVFKRARGQIEGQEKLQFNKSLLKEDAEKSLFVDLEIVEERVKDSLKASNYDSAYGALADLQKPLALLFDQVRIIAEDKSLKNNRVALLQRVFALFAQLLDFSKIQKSKTSMAR